MMSTRDVIRAGESPSPICRQRSKAWSVAVSEGATFDDLVALSKLLFVRGDVLGRIADHDRAESICYRSDRVGAR